MLNNEDTCFLPVNSHLLLL